MIYLASPWFNQEQEKARQDMIRVLTELELGFFSPKEFLVFDPSEPGMASIIFKTNVKYMDEADCFVVNTVGKDMGTIFEAGYAYAKGKDIIYYFPSDHKFNLMLSESANAVAQTPEEFKQCLLDRQYNRDSLKYTGPLE